MKEQDTEESVIQDIDGAPPTMEEMEGAAAAKDVTDSSSSKESEPETPQTNTPPTVDGAESEGNGYVVVSFIFHGFALPLDML